MNNRFPATGESRFWFSLIVSGLGGRLMFCFGLRSGRLLVLDQNLATGVWGAIYNKKSRLVHKDDCI